MPSPSSATITSGLAAASRLKMPLAVVTVTPAWVLAMPTSLKVSAATAPASSIESASRISETPVSLAAATLSPPRASPRTSSVAATVLPAFMQVPATYTTGTVLSSRVGRRHRAIPDVRRPADPVAQLGEGENRAEHFGLEGRTDVGIDRGAPARGCRRG